jgi:hypothetical protein
MYDASFPPPSVPPPAPTVPPPKTGKSWPPILGILSVVTVIFPFLFFCAFCAIFYYIGSQVNWEVEAMTDQNLATIGFGFLFMLCASVLVSFAGIAIGLGALFGKTANKVLGIIGLVANVFMLLSIICLTVILFVL